MRERLTVAFVLLAITVVIGAGAVRSYTILNLLRDDSAAHLREHAELISGLLEERYTEDEPITARYIASVAPEEAKVVFTPEDGEPVVSVGEAFEAGSNDIAVSSTGPLGTVSVTEAGKGLSDIVTREPTMLFTLLLLVATVAGLIGYVAARQLARPLEQLAEAAGALGRGRFDLDLPKTRMPEAQAIGSALRTSAVQLESRIRRERSFSEQASHELRTPITTLRLELEDLMVRDDVPDDVRASAKRCLAQVDGMESSAGRLVELTRGSLMEGAEVPLEQLAKDVAQRWADRLAERRRKLTATVEGDLDLMFTPGPVEQVTDLVLSDVAQAGAGPVRMRLFAEERYLRIRLPAGTISEPGRSRFRRNLPQPGSGVDAARDVATAFGGKVTGSGVADDLEVLLPRR